MRGRRCPGEMALVLKTDTRQTLGRRSGPTIDAMYVSLDRWSRLIFFPARRRHSSCIYVYIHVPCTVYVCCKCVCSDLLPCWHGGLGGDRPQWGTSIMKPVSLQETNVPVRTYVLLLAWCCGHGSGNDFFLWIHAYMVRELAQVPPLVAIHCPQHLYYSIGSRLDVVLYKLNEGCARLTAWLIDRSCCAFFFFFCSLCHLLLFFLFSARASCTTTTACCVEL